MTILPKMTITTVDDMDYSISEQIYLDDPIDIDLSTTKLDVEFNGVLYHSVPCKFYDTPGVFAVGEFTADFQSPILTNYPFAIIFLPKGED